MLNINSSYDTLFHEYRAAFVGLLLPVTTTNERKKTKELRTNKYRGS
jgi:hypothetical protein